MGSGAAHPYEIFLGVPPPPGFPVTPIIDSLSRVHAEYMTLTGLIQRLAKGKTQKHYVYCVSLSELSVKVLSTNIKINKSK